MAHLHLLLNHFPTIGSIIGFALFLVAAVGKNDDLRRASLGVLVLIALLAMPVYMSGNAAQPELENRPGVSKASIARHQDAALLALILMEITGAVAWFELWRFRPLSAPARRSFSAILLLSILTVVLMARAANIGGEIRHPEILSNQGVTVSEGESGSEAGWLKTASIVASFVTYYPWVWPASETLHFVGLCLLFGVVLLINLRMLGMLKKVPSAALHRLLPWAILGFAINFVTGMLFFVANPAQYTQNVAFYWKMALILLAGGNALCLTLFDDAWALTAKSIALSSIFLWIGVIFFGRMLPYIGSE